MLLADKGYDANALRNTVTERKAWANIPPKANCKDPICFSPCLYKARNLVERFFNKTNQFRRIATRYDKPADAALKLVSIRIWLRGNESTSQSLHRVVHAAGCCRLHVFAGQGFFHRNHRQPACQEFALAGGICRAGHRHLGAECRAALQRRAVSGGRAIRACGAIPLCQTDNGYLQRRCEGWLCRRDLELERRLSNDNIPRAGATAITCKRTKKPSKGFQKYISINPHRFRRVIGTFPIPTPFRA